MTRYVSVSDDANVQAELREIYERDYRDITPRLIELGLTPPGIRDGDPWPPALLTWAPGMSVDDDGLIMWHFDAEEQGDDLEDLEDEDPDAPDPWNT